jgi:hypothetical protein
VSVVLCTVFRLFVVLFCVMCVVCVFCLIVVPLPPGENPFAIKINNIKKSTALLAHRFHSRLLARIWSRFHNIVGCFLLRSYIYTEFICRLIRHLSMWCRAAAFFLCFIHRVHCAGLSDDHGAFQYAVPRKWRSTFAGSSDGKINVQSACALNTRCKRNC